MSRLEPGAAGGEARTLPLCYAATVAITKHHNLFKGNGVLEAFQLAEVQPQQSFLLISIALTEMKSELDYLGK